MALLLLAILLLLTLVSSSTTIGVNYGQVANNLPPPSSAALLLHSLKASRIKLYDADPKVLTAFANTGSDFTIGLPDNVIPRLATDPNFASSWVHTNLLPHLPATSVSAVTVGNEVLSGDDTSLARCLVPAMESLNSAICDANLTGRVVVTTAHSLAILGSSFPPSSAVFKHELLPYIVPLLNYLMETNSPFLINAYPYFAYKADPDRVDLNYVLFEQNPGTVDPGTGLRYTNMLHAQVDAVRAAIQKAVGKPVKITVSETGWPSKGDDDEAGATLENAAKYNGNLMKLVAEGKGTPAAPDEALQVYVFALFNENLKPGPASEQHYGLFRPDGTPAYDLGVNVTTAGGKGNETADGGGGGPTGLVVAEGPGGFAGGGSSTGFYSVSSASKVGMLSWIERLLVTALSIMLGVCWC